MIACLSLPLLFAPLVPSAQEVTYPPERQIRWERTLEDALELSSTTGRPLFIAVNTDAESACERIVRELYRDPEFVALTRYTVNVVASPWRHTPRDVDEHGRRVPSPRLGCVTCGEHVALEPQVFERFLGDLRVAPRHALVRSDGTLVFDLYYQFDLREVERRLRAEFEGLPLPPEEPLPPSPLELTDPVERRAAWSRLAAGRSSRAREHLEAIAAEVPAWMVDELLDALVAQGDKGAIWTLRPLLLDEEIGPRVAWRLPELTRALDLRAEVTAALREDLAAALTRPGEFGLGSRSHLLMALASLEPEDGASRSLLASYAASAVPGREARAARRAMGGLGERLALPPYPGPRGAGRALDPLGLLDLYRAGSPETAPPLEEDPRTAPELEAALGELESAGPEERVTLDHKEALGRASLSLARRRIAEGGSGIEFLLEDAERALAEVLREDPARVELWLLRARIAYQQSRFADQEAHALRALALFETMGTDGLDPRLQDAWRWLADGAARMAAARSGGDPLEEIRGFLHGFHAAARAATNRAAANDRDWVTLSQVYGLVGRRREELAICRAGLEIWPESNALRAALATAAWDVGRTDATVTAAVELVRTHPESAACHWYEGQARVGRAEVLRRAERPAAALREYEYARQAFERSLELAPDFAGTVTDYLARIELGIGFAHLLVDRQGPAAEALVRALTRLPEVRKVRDGLDREALDLLDAALEWRERGESPVEGIDLLAGLERAAPDDAAFWAVHVADTGLREALRAEGRGDEPAAPRWHRIAVRAGLRALELGLEDAEERRMVAQALTAWGRRLLTAAEPQGDLDRARFLLARAREALGLDSLGPEPSPEELSRAVVEMREFLGEERPADRPGR